MSKVLFILKRREDFNAQTHSHVGLSTGLYNSASFVCDMLQASGTESKLSVVIDNNCIDREVTAYKPTHVIIEALWVVPEKFSVLCKLHPDVTWVIRVHSEMPFMAGEGMAMDWLGDYSGFPNIVIGINAPRMLREIRMYLQHRNSWTDAQAQHRVFYLPNYYPQDYVQKPLDRSRNVVDIGCFGAVRPLKNHLLQAFGALEFAEKIGKRLRFHINSGRIEMNGGPVQHNLQGLFEQLSHQGHQLINHTWCPRADFLKVCASMDIGLQVSFSETFNIVGADMISQGVPLVGSSEIPWSIRWFNANPVDSTDICNKLIRAWHHPQINIRMSQYSLTHYTSETQRIWHKYFV